jgi:phage terminase large subunit GpA-like protein
MEATAQRQLDVPRYRGAHGAAVREGMTPKPRLKVSQTAARSRFIAPGVRYSLRKTPYMAEPMDCMEPGQYLTVGVVGPGQCGKTNGAENLLQHSIMNSPGDFLWFMQSDDALQAYVKKTIDQMIEMHPDMKAALGLKAIDDSLHFKRFRTLTVEFLTATEKNMINKKAPRIVGDEIDAYPKDLGDPKVLLDVRRQTYGAESILVALSHPDRGKGLRPETDWTEGILAIYADSDRRVWWWPCPCCGAYSSPNPTASRVMVLAYDEEKDLDPDKITGEIRKRPASLDEVETSAHLLCPVNGCQIADKHRRKMNSTGFWAGEGQVVAQDGTITGQLVKRKTAGFWIVGLMSPFLIGGIGGLARARVKAERDYLVTGEDKTLRQVMTKQFGVPYVPSKMLGSVTANGLADRADPRLRLGEIPEGVRFLVCAVDVQVGFFEWLLRGYGIDGESWIIDRGRILADPATNPADWDKLPEKLFSQTWPMAGNSGQSMAIRASCIDSGGAPGVTEQAYSAWRRWRQRRVIRYYGQVGGKGGPDAFNIMLTKGNAKPSVNMNRLSVVYPDTKRQANVVAKGEIPVALFSPNLFKDELLGQLLRDDPGPGFVNFPAGMSAGFPHGLRSDTNESPHPWFEQLVAEARLPDGKWQLLTASARNEALDLMVMSNVMATLHGIRRIKWDRPPVWAAPWEFNSLVKGPQAVTPEGEPIPQALGPVHALDVKPTVTVKVDQVAPKPTGRRLPP